MERLRNAQDEGLFPLEVVVIFPLSTMKSTHFPLTSGIHFPIKPPQSPVFISVFCTSNFFRSTFGFLFFGPTKRGRNEATKSKHQLQLPLGRWRPPGGLWVGASSQIPRNARASAHHPWGQRRRTKARRLVHDTRRRQGRVNSGTCGSRNVARIGPAVVGDFGDFCFDGEKT